jgi:CheY-like chemotaxis protein
MNSTKRTTAVILLIDNNPLSLTGLAAILDMAGHECHCARDAEATVKALHGLDLDLIVCNVDFDGDSSPALYQRLVAAGRKRDVPLLFLSSSAPHPTLIQVLASGEGLFLPSPFSHEQLLRAVDRALWMPHLVRQHSGLAAEIPAPAERLVDDPCMQH